MSQYGGITLPPARELWGPCPPEWGSARAPSPQPEPTLLSAGVLAAPGLLQGASPQPRDPPAPQSRSRDKGQCHQHTSQHFIATAATGHPSSQRGSGPGPGPGPSPVVLLGPLHDSHSPRPPSWPPRSSLTASLPSCSRAGRRTKGAERASVLPASFPAGGRAPPGCRGGQVTPPCPAPAPGPAPAPSPRSARSSASVALRGEESGCWGPVCWGGGPGVGDEGSW